VLGLAAALYSLQLQHWLAHFKPTQFLVVSFEALRGSSSSSGGSSSGSAATANQRALHRALLEHIVRFSAGTASTRAAALAALRDDSQAAASATARRVASFSHLAHDRATLADLATLQRFFAPFNRELAALLYRERIQLAPAGLSATDVADWGYN
jgi:hypothetical protein